jgi:hypothetical protein
MQSVLLNPHVTAALKIGTRGHFVGEAFLRGDRKQCCDEKVND